MFVYEACKYLKHKQILNFKKSIVLVRVYIFCFFLNRVCGVCVYVCEKQNTEDSLESRYTSIHMPLNFQMCFRQRSECTITWRLFFSHKPCI